MKFLIIYFTLFITCIYAGDKTCPDTNCAATSCPTIQESAEMCRGLKQAFIYPDLICNCCGKCAPVEDVVDRKLLKCETNQCQVSLCQDDSLSSCNTSRQVFVFKDQSCFCCNKCVNKKKCHGKH